jgi:predicted NUDIX family NTP pyrophosphohydrolase
MPERSAGILLFRRTPSRIEVLLVHPGGPFWASKDDGAWSIPKGEYGRDEEAVMAARREFAEETGAIATGTLLELGTVRQPGGKCVTAWALEGDFDPATLSSNTFTMEWPPRSGRAAEFPEVDRAAWHDIETARRKLNRGQVPFLDALIGLLGG